MQLLGSQRLTQGHFGWMSPCCDGGLNFRLFKKILSFAFFILSCEIDTNITTFIDSLTSEMFFATCLAFPLSREETLTKAAASVG